MTSLPPVEVSDFSRSGPNQSTWSMLMKNMCLGIIILMVCLCINQNLMPSYVPRKKPFRLFTKQWSQYSKTAVFFFTEFNCWTKAEKLSSRIHKKLRFKLNICYYAKHMRNICYGKIKYWFYWALLYMLNLFFSIVHCKPNSDDFIRRFVTTEPTKDVNGFFPRSSRASHQKIYLRRYQKT